MTGGGVETGLAGARELAGAAPRPLALIRPYSRGVPRLGGSRGEAARAPARPRPYLAIRVSPAVVFACRLLSAKPEHVHKHSPRRAPARRPPRAHAGATAAGAMETDGEDELARGGGAGGATAAAAAPRAAARRPAPPAPRPAAGGARRGFLIQWEELNGGSRVFESSRAAGFLALI
jgi:hypothetical protein